MKKKAPPHQITLSFEDNTLLPALFGDHDLHLARIEQELGVSLHSRGNQLTVSGSEKSVELVESVLTRFYRKLKQGQAFGEAELIAALRMAKTPAPTQTKQVRPAIPGAEDVAIRTQKGVITPYTHRQIEYMQALKNNSIVFGAGPAGTGKTYLAVAAAVNMFLNHEVTRIILSRPAVEAGEKLGFLPGDLREKVDPYLRPLYDALYDMLPAEKVMRCMESGEIEIAPLAFMRGRTLRHSYIILDEAQNCTAMQMKMFLTRIGEGSRMAITGDLSQTDLPKDVKSGFRDAIEKLKHLDEVKIVHFEGKDSVRHPLTVKIVQAYEAHDRKFEKKYSY